MQIHKENKELIDAMRKDAKDFQIAMMQEAKDFHARLCAIEERNRSKQ